MAQENRPWKTCKTNESFNTNVQRTPEKGRTQAYARPNGKDRVNPQI